MLKKSLIILTSLIIGVAIGFTPAFFFTNKLHNDIENFKKETMDRMTELLDKVSKIEGIDFFHTSCQAGDKNSCVILKTMLEIYNEQDNLDS